MKTVASLLCFILIATLMSAKPPANLQEKLDDWIKGQPGGIAVAWVDADGTAFFQAGRLDGEDSGPITPDTRFELGSVTKVFTSLLLAESERLGKVSRNDPAAKYLLTTDDPDQVKLAKITLLSLATHTSGLPRLPANLGPNPDASPDPYATYDRNQLVAALRQYGPTAEVGSSAAYSNYGVAVLGEALAAAWGTSYAEALREHVLAPLGMTATSVGLTGAPAPAGLAPGHAGGARVPSWTFQAFAPAGALRSSAREMAAFLTACLGGEAQPLHAAIEATLQPEHAMEDTGGHIGLGWMLTDDADHPIVWHGGATAGYRAFVGFSTRNGTGVVVLANMQKAPEPLGFGLLGGRLPSPKVSRVNDAAGYVGRYPLSPAFALDITEVNGALRGQATGQPSFGLRPAGPDRFAIVGVLSAEISFERGADGKVRALVLHQNGQNMPAPRGPLPAPVAPSVETLREYIGSYPLTPQFVLTVTEEGGVLLVQASGQPKWPVFASARDEFFYKVVDAQISFQRDGSGKVAGLVLHQNGQDLPGLRQPTSAAVADFALPAEILRDYAGTYPLTPQFALSVTEADGALFVQVTGQQKLPVFASAKDEFFYKVVDARLSFQRDAAGKVVGVVLHQGGRDTPAKKAP